MDKPGNRYVEEAEFQGRIFREKALQVTRSTGNRLELFADGDEAFRAMWEAVDSARKRVWLEVYTFDRDKIGRRTLQALKEACDRGCETILILDRFGSRGMNDGFLRPLREAGGIAVAFNPFWPWGKIGHQVGSILHRDHRKILVVDDEIGFCGGMNISEDYAGKELGNARFRDLMLRVEGPAARQLASVFLKSLDETAHMNRSLSMDDPRHSEHVPGGAFVQVLGLNARREKEMLQSIILRALREARERCYLTTPYFVPPARIEKALTEAAVRGVDTRVLTALRSDIPPARIAGRYVYEALLKSGVRIYEMESPTLHAKSLTIDGTFGLVGSYNVDRWSSRHNLEVGVSAIDAGLATALEDMFVKNLKRSQEIPLGDWKQRPLLQRLFQWVLYRVAVISVHRNDSGRA